MISFEVIVVRIRLNSSFVDSSSVTRMRVPSDRTTRSRGAIRKANGNLRHSQYIGWAVEQIARRCQWKINVRQTLDSHKGNVRVRRDAATSTLCVVLCQAGEQNADLVTRSKEEMRHGERPVLLDGTANQLSQVSRHNPERQVLSTSPRGRKR